MINENDSITITESNTCLAKYPNAKVVDSINGIEETGINWLVAEKPLCYMGNKKVKGYKILVRQDKPEEQISLAKESYSVIQNSRIWEAMHHSLAGIPFKIRLALSTDSLSKIAIQVELLEGETKVNGDSFKSFFTFASSHDGSTPFVLKESATRAVCENTLAMAIKENVGVKLSIRHSKNCEVAIANAESIINGMADRRKEFYANLERFAGQPFVGQSREERIRKAKAFLSGLYVRNGDLSTRTENKIDAIMDILTINGIAISREITRYDVLNAGTEFFTHYSTDTDAFSSHKNENPAKQFESSEFGISANEKIALYNSLLSDDQIDGLIAKGERLLAAPKKPRKHKDEESIEVAELVEA